MNDNPNEFSQMLTNWVNTDLHDKVLFIVKKRNRHIEYSIVPKTPGACPIKILVSDVGGYVVLLGDSLQFESEDGYQIDEVLQILGAVVAGKVRETLWYRGNEIIKSTGEVDAGQVQFKRKRSRLSAIFLKPDSRVEMKYVAY